MKAKVDEEKCIACQTCEVMCPVCFKMESGVAQYVGDGSCDCELERIAESCPVEAIELSEK